MNTFLLRYKEDNMSKNFIKILILILFCITLTVEVLAAPWPFEPRDKEHEITDSYGQLIYWPVDPNHPTDETYLHQGIDIFKDNLTNVIAMESGTIIDERCDPAQGLFISYVTINESLNGAWSYTHLIPANNTHVYPAYNWTHRAPVNAGDRIGVLYSPWQAYAHVHLERVNDNDNWWQPDEDPLLLLNPRTDTTPPTIEKEFFYRNATEEGNDDASYFNTRNCVDLKIVQDNIDIIINATEMFRNFKNRTSVQKIQFKIQDKDYNDLCPYQTLEEFNDRFIVGHGNFDDQNLIWTIYENDDTLKVPAWYNSVKGNYVFYYIVTNKDGDDTLEATDADIYWDTDGKEGELWNDTQEDAAHEASSNSDAAFPDGTYYVTAYVNDEALNGDLEINQIIVNNFNETVESANETGHVLDTFIEGDTLFINGSGFQKNKDYMARVYKNRTWSDCEYLVDIAGDLVVRKDITTDGSGNVPVGTKLIDELNVGEYDILIDYDNDFNYTEPRLRKTVDALDDNDVKGAGFEVLPANWTIMIYMAAENNLEDLAFKDINDMEKEGPNENVSVFVQVDWKDKFDGNVTRYNITKDSDLNQIKSPVLKTFDELNMGDPQTLVDFVNWTVQISKTSRYLLILWDNGDGWKVNPSWPAGLLQDKNPSNDAMEMGELASALNTIAGPTVLNKKLDIIGFDAPLMAMVEVAFQVRDSSKYFVASQSSNTSKGNEPPTRKEKGWDYDDILSKLKTSQTKTPRKYAELIVEHAQTNPAIDTLSAVYLPNVSALVDVTNRLADPDDLRGRRIPLSPPPECPADEPLRTGLFDYKICNLYSDNIQTKVLEIRRNKVQTFGGVIDKSVDVYSYDLDYTPLGNELRPKRLKTNDPVWGDMDYIDLYHFAELVKNENGIDDGYKDYADDVMDKVKEAVVKEYHSGKFPNAHGLSIYFPYQQRRVNLNYTDNDDPLHEYSYDDPDYLSSKVYHQTLDFPTNIGAIWWKDDVDSLDNWFGRLLTRYYYPVADAEICGGEGSCCQKIIYVSVGTEVTFSGVGSSEADYEAFSKAGAKLEAMYMWNFGDGGWCVELWDDKPPLPPNNDGQVQPVEMVLNTCDPGQLIDGIARHRYLSPGCYIVTLTVADDFGRDDKSEIDWVYVIVEGKEPIYATSYFEIENSFVNEGEVYYTINNNITLEDPDYDSTIYDLEIFFDEQDITWSGGLFTGLPEGWYYDDHENYTRAYTNDTPLRVDQTVSFTIKAVLNIDDPAPYFMKTHATDDAHGNLGYIYSIQDSDRDGILNPMDNCVYTPNPLQNDTNFDGYGTKCDTDVDNDGNTTLADASICEEAFNSYPGHSRWNPDCDFNEDNKIDLTDMSKIIASIGLPPGPSYGSNQDGDGWIDERDNCWYVKNPYQNDTDEDCPALMYWKFLDPQCGDACEVVPTILEVVPSINDFYTNTTSVGDTFTVDLDVINVTDLFLWQTKLYFNPELLNVTHVWLPSDNIFAGRTIACGGPLIDNTEGYILYGCVLLDEPAVNGSGTLSSVEFEIIEEPSVNESLSCGLNFSTPYGAPMGTYLMNSTGTEIYPVEMINGYYEYTWIPSLLTLSLSPDPIWAEKTVTANINCNVDCSGKTAYVGRGEKKVTVCSCVAATVGCSCTFTAPKLTTTESVETYYARIDLDGNKVYNETETASDNLTVYCKAAGESCSSTETCCAGAYCISGTCKYPSGPGGGSGARPK